MVPQEVGAHLRRQLMNGRTAVSAALRAHDAPAEAEARAVVHRAKSALGERGTPWWEQAPQDRRRRWEAGLDGSPDA